MVMNKRTITVLMALLLTVFLLVACNGDADSGEPAPADNAQASDDNVETQDVTDDVTDDDVIVIGMSIDTTGQAWRAGLVRDVTEEAARHPNVELVVTDAQGSGTRQINDIEDLMTLEVDVIMISPHEGGMLAPIVAEAYQSGIPVLVLDREIPGDQFTSFIGADNLSIGELAGEFILQYMQDNGLTRFVEIQGLPGSATKIDRSDPVIAALSEDPNIEIVAQQAANWDESEALQVMENLLQAFPEGTIDIIYSHADPMTLGILTAMRSADRMEIRVVSIDGQRQVLEAIQRGEVTTTFTYPFPGAEGVRTAIRVAQGEDVPRRIYIPSVQIDENNVDELYDPEAAF
jgi:ABC-type sugar transport system substrate-binding protein